MRTDHSECGWSWWASYIGQTAKHQDVLTFEGDHLCTTSDGFGEIVCPHCREVSPIFKTTIHTQSCIYVYKALWYITVNNIPLCFSLPVFSPHTVVKCLLIILYVKPTIFMFLSCFELSSLQPIPTLLWLMKKVRPKYIKFHDWWHHLRFFIIFSKGVHIPSRLHSCIVFFLQDFGGRNPYLHHGVPHIFFLLYIICHDGC